MSDGFEHEVEFLGPFAAGDDLHFAVAGFGLGQAEGFDVSVFGEHFGRDGVEVESGAVVFGQFVFEAVGGHVVLAAAVDDGGNIGPEAFGLADGVDGGVAAAEDGDAAADGDFVERFGVDPLDEFEGVDHFGEIFAGNAEAVGPAEAEGEEDGVVVFFEFVDGEVLADLHAVLKFHTEALDHFDFVETDFGRHFVVGDAVGVEAAAFFLFVEDGGFVTELGEFRRAAESGRAGAEDGDFFTVLFRRGLEDVDVVVENVVGGVALESSDFHGITFQIEDHAGSFTEDFSRADTSATGAEDIGGEDGSGGAGRIPVGDFFDERRDVDAGGAGHNARGVEAEETAVGFDQRFLRGVAGLLLRHVAGGGLGIEERLNRHRGNFQCSVFSGSVKTFLAHLRHEQGAFP